MQYYCLLPQVSQIMQTNTKRPSQQSAEDIGSLLFRYTSIETAAVYVTVLSCPIAGLKH